MNCIKCGKSMEIKVRVGVIAPSELEGQFTKTMFKRKDVQIEYADWDTASYVCPECGFIFNSSRNYIDQLKIDNAELKKRIEALEKEVDFNATPF